MAHTLNHPNPSLFRCLLSLSSTLTRSLYLFNFVPDFFIRFLSFSFHFLSHFSTCSFSFYLCIISFTFLFCISFFSFFLSCSPFISFTICLLHDYLFLFCLFLFCFSVILFQLSLSFYVFLFSVLFSLALVLFVLFRTCDILSFRFSLIGLVLQQ